MSAAWLILAVGGGYVLGRVCPWRRLGHWIDWRLPDDGRWWLASWPLRAALLVTNPRMARSAWCRRDDHGEAGGG